MSYELSGKLFLKEDEVVVSDRFKKREFVVLKEENNGGQIYSDYVKFQLTQDKCQLLDSCNVEDDVTVKFNIKGNEWEKDGKKSYFNNLNAWSVSNVDSKPKEDKVNTSSSSSMRIPKPTEESTDDLPF